MRRLGTTVGLAVLGLGAATGVARGAPDEDRVLDRQLLADGSRLTVSVMQGTHLAVRTEGSKGLNIQAHPIADILGGGEVLSAKATPRAAGDVLVGLVLRRGDSHRVHWVTTSGGKDGGWRTGALPVASDATHRIVEVRDIGEGRIEVTLRAGNPGEPTAFLVFAHEPGTSFTQLLRTDPARALEIESLDGTATVERSGPPPRRNPQPAPPPPTPARLLATLVLSADGGAALHAPEAKDASWTGSFSAGVPSGFAAALGGLVTPDVSPTSDRAVRLAVRADEAVSWGRIASTLSSAASANVGRFRLAEVDLDLSRRASMGMPEPTRLVVLVLRDAKGTSVRIGNPLLGADIPLAAGDGRAEAVTAVAERIHARRVPGIEGIDVRLEGAGDLPLGDVLSIVRAAKASRVRLVRLPGVPDDLVIR